MGIIDKIKSALGGASEKASSAADKAGVGDLADKVGEAATSARSTVGGAVENAVDKVADKADEATGGKYSDKIDKVRDAADKLDGQDDPEVTTMDTPVPPASTPKDVPGAGPTA